MGEIKIKKGVPSYLLSDEAPATVEAPTPPAVAEPASQGASEGSVKKTNPPAASPKPIPPTRAAAAPKPPVTEPVSPGESDLPAEIRARNLAQRRLKAMGEATSGPGFVITDPNRPPEMGRNLGRFNPPTPPKEKAADLQAGIDQARREADQGQVDALSLRGMLSKEADRTPALPVPVSGMSAPWIAPAVTGALDLTAGPESVEMQRAASELKDKAQQDRSVASARARVLREMRDAAMKE